MKIFIIIFIAIIILALIAAIIYGSVFLYNLAINPNYPKDLIFPKSNDATKQCETSGAINYESEKWFFEKSNYKDFYISSQDGLKLHNYVIENQLKSNNWVIVVHGYTSQGKLMSSYAKKFYEMGLNILVPDLRGHGLSEGAYIGMGWHERLDILSLINHLVETNPTCKIILFGVSMGATTVMNVSGEEIPSNVKAIIEDCGYTSTWNQFSYHLKKMFKLPPFPMLHCASLICKIKNGFWISEGSSLSQIKNSKTPMLFIHGDADAFVPYSMLDEIYLSAPEPKEKLIIPNAKHAKASYVDAKIYWTKVKAFIDKYLSNNS